MTIKYKIEFHTDWHCGSGLAAGADMDALVVKDKNNMPYVPGKTIKGLVREAIEEIRRFQSNNDTSDIDAAFGFFKDMENLEKGCLFFTNAELSEVEYNAIVSNKATHFLYRSISNTAIGENGIAKDNSLRKTQFVVPCTLYGEILGVPDALASELEASFGFIKHLGQMRNRGYGRCTISVMEKKGDIQ